MKLNALVKLSTIMRSAVEDGLIQKNPADSIQLPKRVRKEVDPSTLEEADKILGRMYAGTFWPSSIYAAFFFTGLRLSEALRYVGMRWTWTRGSRTSSVRLPWGKSSND